MNYTQSCISSIYNYGVMCVYTCRYLGGQNFTIDKTRFTFGTHFLEVMFVSPYNDEPAAAFGFRFTIRRKFLYVVV